MKKIISLLMAVVLVVATGAFTKADAKAAKTDYSAVFDAAFYSAAYPDLAVLGNDEAKLLNHFVSYGMAEGRQGNADFNVNVYKARYADLQAVFGNDLTKYYLHYINYGKAEGRSGKAAAAKTTTSTTTTAKAPANSMKYGTGYIPLAVGQETLLWINSQRSDAKVNTITWSDSMAQSARVRSIELSMTFNSGRPDGTQWSTAYDKSYGEIKELFFKLNGAATDADIKNAIANNTDRMKYIKTEGLTKCGISVYIKDNVSYVILSFSKPVEEKK